MIKYKPTKKIKAGVDKSIKAGKKFKVRKMTGIRTGVRG